MVKRILASEVKDLPLNMIDFPEDDLRIRRDEGKIGELAKSMRRLGQLVPILVRRKNGGRYEVLDGCYRILAARSLGWETVKAVEAVPDRWDEDAVMIHVNAIRVNLTPLDVARRARLLMQRYNMDLGEVSSVLGLSKATISKCLKIDEGLSEEDKRKLLEGRMTFRQAYAKVKASRSTRPRLRPCSRCGHEYGLEDLRPIFLCPSCYQYVAQERLGGGGEE